MHVSAHHDDGYDAHVRPDSPSCTLNAYPQFRPDTVEVVAEEERQMQTSLEVKPGKRNPEEPDVDQLLADGDEERYYQAAKAQQEMDEDAWVTECMKREDEEARRQLVEFQAAAYKDCESWTALNTPQLEGIRKRMRIQTHDFKGSQSPDLRGGTAAQITIGDFPEPSG